MRASHDEEFGAPPFVLDRRRTPDRRSTWRGGRRDSDWLNRPPHAALEGIESDTAVSTGSWRTLLHSLHLSRD